MRRSYGLCACLLILVALSPICASEANRHFTVAEFRSIEISGVDRIDIRQGDRTAVDAQGNPDDLTSLSISARGGVLRISRPNRLERSLAVAVTVLVPQVERVAIKGAGAAKLTNLRGTILQLTGRGAVRFDLRNVSVQDLRVGLLGAGNISTTGLAASRIVFIGEGADTATFAGTVRDLDVTLGGTGRFDSSRMPANVARLNVRGVAQLTANVAETAEIRRSGLAKVDLLGMPTCNITGDRSGITGCRN